MVRRVLVLVVGGVPCLAEVVGGAAGLEGKVGLGEGQRCLRWGLGSSWCQADGASAGGWSSRW